jgi:hypothetical protein
MQRLFEVTESMSEELAGATVDATGQYRYNLWRKISSDPGRVVFVMLNPSTADASHDDPTILRCCSFAKMWGYGRVEVVNLFAFRATSPSVMKAASDPIGTENDAHIRGAVLGADLVIAAWGNHGSHLNRGEVVRRMLPATTRCLARNKSGEPKHPLYVAGTETPQLLRPDDGWGAANNAGRFLEMQRGRAI